MKKVLIIGATSGIGSKLSTDLIDDFDLIVTGRDAQKLKDVSGKGILLDLEDIESFDSFIDELPELYGVVYCAGVTTHTPVKFIKKEHIESVFNVNVFGAISIISKLLKQKKISDSGSVVLLSSIATQYPYFGGSLYVASKLAMEGFAKSLAIELSNKKIRVNCVAPSFVKTNMVKSMEEFSSEDALDIFSKKHPMGVVEVNDVNNLINYLLSDQSKLISGQIMNVGNFNTGLSS